LTKFDAGVIAICALTFAVGWRRGIARTVLPVVGGIGGLAVGGAFAPRIVLAVTSPADVAARAALLCVAFIGLPMIGVLVGAWLAGDAGRSSRLTWVSHLLGGVAAVALLALVGWILAPMSQRQEAFVSASAGSVTADVVDALPPAPVDVDKLVAEGVLPASLGVVLGPPSDVPAPTQLPAMTAEAEALLRQATVQLFVFKCGGIGTGSGFAVDANLIATNAHVVRGASDRVEVRTHDDRRRVGAVVLYDEERDLALVHVDDLGLAPLALAPEQAEYGEIVVTAGHPHADPALHIAPARVDAIGFHGPQSQPDGLATVRHLYTLRSDDVKPGSSGGPLVNSAAEVLGVVFAVREGGGVASAVAADEVQVVFERYNGPAAVSTGSC
jgi:S1-C subfamily serine protease